MNEAQRCDRISMMHAGRVLDSDVPAALVTKRGAATLEEAFIGYLLEAADESKTIAGSASPATNSQEKHTRTKEQSAQAATEKEALTAHSACSACSAAHGASPWSCAATLCTLALQRFRKALRSMG